MPIDFVLAPTFANLSTKPAANVAFYFDPRQVRRLLASATQSGFDAVIIDDASGPLANVDIAADVAQWNKQLDVLLTHWADVTSPLVAASEFASLDRLTGGRLSLRLLAGEPGNDGHAATWQRTDEYLTLLKRLWSHDRPIDYEGPFYSLKNAYVADKGLRGHKVPIRMSGNTKTQIDVAARHATVFELAQTDVEQLSRQMERVVAAASRYGRSGKISFSAHLHSPEGSADSRVDWVSTCIEAGITEFMVSGLNDAAEIERFGAEIIAPARGDGRMTEREAPSLVATSLAMGFF